MARCRPINLFYVFIYWAGLTPTSFNLDILLLSINENMLARNKERLDLSQNLI